jgi:predicted lipoprotein with Yx(FWY)xxD motif
MFKPQRIVFVTALIAIAAVAGSAMASAHNTAAMNRSPMSSQKTTLHVLKSKIAGYASASIIVTSNGHAVYELSGDSAKHPKCNSTGCLSVWPAVTAKHPSEKGISGKLGVWHHRGIYQVTLGGHPLYTYAGDSSSGNANGNGFKSFGGTWWVRSSHDKSVTAKASSGSKNTGDTTTTPVGDGW